MYVSHAPSACYGFRSLSICRVSYVRPVHSFRFEVLRFSLLIVAYPVPPPPPCNRLQQHAVTPLFFVDSACPFLPIRSFATIASPRPQQPTACTHTPKLFSPFEEPHNHHVGRT